MSSPPSSDVRTEKNRGMVFVVAIAVAKLAFHLLTANRYGIFRDEMYGLACADHLDWGYVDHPPGGIVIAWLARHLFGDSLLGLRFLPAVGGAATVWLSGLVARELGGRTFAQSLAAFAVAVAPIYVVFDHWLMMNAFEPLVWLACLWCLLRAFACGRTAPLVWFGVLAGVGVEMKYSIVFLIAGVLVGLLLTPQRVLLRRPALWVGLTLGAAIAFPNFLWQAAHGFPFLELMHNIRSGSRDVVRAPVGFLLDQMVIMGPAIAPMWVAGVGWLWAGRDRARFAVFAWAFAIVVAVFIATRGKNYYVTPVYPIAIAAGAVACEALRASRAGRYISNAYFGAVVIVGLVLLPLSAPLLSPATFVRYEAWLHVAPPEFEHQNHGPLPQYFADEFGWEDMVREVARVYHALPAPERARAAIFSNQWAQASAVDFFGPKYGLPRAISKHNSYWLWGPRDYTGEIVIILASDGRHDGDFFTAVEKAGHVEHPLSRRDTWFDVYVCRGLKTDLRALWPRLKQFD